jgi:hypothetical protein
MNSRATRQFWKLYFALPLQIQRRARRAYLQWRNDPRHPSLHFKRVSEQEPLFSARVSEDYRVLGWLRDNTMVWFWIGKHEEYERIIKA